MAESEKGRGKAVHEIILETERGRSPVQGQINRIIDEQTEMIRRQLEKSQMEQLLKESERKSKEEDLRMRKVEDDQKPLPTQPEEKTSEAKTILDAVRIGVEVAKPQQQSQGSVADMAKSIVEALKIGVDMGKAQTQQPQQQGYAEKYLDLLLGELKMARQEQSKDREARLEKEIMEIKNKPSGMEEIARDAEKFSTYRKMFGGGDTATANEYTLKKLEMEQTERLDDRKLGFEEKKWEYEKANEGKTMEQVTNLIKTVGEGSIGKAIENMGSGVGERLKTGKNNNSPQLIKIQCPKCYGQFSVNPDLQTVLCTHCGAVLQSTPPTPQSQPEPPPVTQELQQQQIDTPQTQESLQQEPSNVQATDQAPAQ